MRADGPLPSQHSSPPSPSPSYAAATLITVNVPDLTLQCSQTLGALMGSVTYGGGRGEREPLPVHRVDNSRRVVRRGAACGPTIVPARSGPNDPGVHEPQFHLPEQMPKGLTGVATVGDWTARKARSQRMSERCNRRRPTSMYLELFSPEVHNRPPPVDVLRLPM